MQEYDVIFKILLQKSLGRLTGKTIVRWLPAELPKVQNLRVDLLGETADGELVETRCKARTIPAYLSACWNISLR